MTVGTGPAALAPRPFGRTGLLVTPLGVGCAALGSMPATYDFAVPEEQALATLRAALAGPLTFLDTSALYGDGESERRIGLALRERGGLPAGVVLSTKAGRDARTGAFDGAQMRRSVKRSLRLLGLDRLPLVHLHGPEHTTFEAATAPGGPVEALQALQREGVIAHLGVAGGPIGTMLRYVATGAFEAVITHNRYTLLNRTAAPLLDVAAQRGLAVVNAAPYGGGLLARGPAAYPRYAYRDAPPEVVATARAMADVCDRHGVPLAAAALQFSLREPRVTATIVGMTRPGHVAETLALARLPIPEALWSELDALAPVRGDPEAARAEPPARRLARLVGRARRRLLGRPDDGG
jgi:D-threo-aldose 1-dehydrogenase